MFRNNSTSLKLETLEARDVPAIVLEGTFVAFGTAPTINGGNVTVSEVALNRTGGVGDPVTDKNITVFQNTNKVANAADGLTFAVNNGTLSISSSDGIFVRVVTGASTFFANFGTTAEIQNVTGLNVNLQLGGDDTVTDNTTLSSTINGGAGNDNITGGGMINPALLPFLSNPAFLPLLAGMGGQKVLQGGAGDDKITGPIFGFFNQLDGGEGNDTIIGGLGLDIITGGAGFDVLFGLGGGDFYLAFDGGPDFVLDQPNDIVFGDPFDL